MDFRPLLLLLLSLNFYYCECAKSISEFWTTFNLPPKKTRPKFKKILDVFQRPCRGSAPRRVAPPWSSRGTCSTTWGRRAGPTTQTPGRWLELPNKLCAFAYFFKNRDTARIWAWSWPTLFLWRGSRSSGTLSVIFSSFPIFYFPPKNNFKSIRFFLAVS